MTIPERPWRKVAFAFVMILVLIPSLRSPLEWFHATQLWDTGTTAALIWLILIALAFFGRNLPRGFGVALTAIALLSGIVSFADNYRLLRPSQEDWNVITALQNAFPDGVTAAFPPSLYRYVDVIRCPMRDDIKFTPIVYLPHPDSTDVLLTVVEGMPESSEHLQPLDSRYTLIRHVKFANAMLSSVGNQFVVLNAELLTPSLVAGGILNIRLDMQFTNQLDEQFSVYGLFVHVTKLDQADEKVLQYGYPIGQEMGTIQKRDMIDNYHVRMALPVDIAVGTYDVIVGFTHNVEVKELARWVVGQVEVLSP